MNKLKRTLVGGALLGVAAFGFAGATTPVHAAAVSSVAEAQLGTAVAPYYFVDSVAHAVIDAATAVAHVLGFGNGRPVNDCYPVGIASLGTADAPKLVRQSLD